MSNSADRIIEIELDEDSLAPAHADAEHERKIAIFDLTEANSFVLEGASHGPYRLRLSLLEQKLVFEVKASDRTLVKTFIISLSPFRRVVRDYFMICESYYDAIRRSTPAQIEAIDMGRRGLHNEGSELLSERLQGKVTVDFDTSRRLFTLICALFPPTFIR
jgi:uncharacterized protein (UPF0262 family)